MWRSERQYMTYPKWELWQTNSSKSAYPKGYFEVPHTPGLWKHISCPIEFSLVVDGFGVKCVGKKHANHIINTLKSDYKKSEDWEGELYCGISLKWNYD